VIELARAIASAWGVGADSIRVGDSSQLHEAAVLRLDSSRARSELRWKPQWSLPTTVEATVEWQRAWLDGKDMSLFTQEQIKSYARPITHE
jgi:CDP-glucose 4,6-dehydratase